MKILAGLDALLRRRETSNPLALFAGAIACYVLYGAAAGFFQGGSQIALAAWKAPLIVCATVLLCVPSLYVFTALGGAELTREAFVRLLAGFAGVAGLILIALMPIVWLFSVSTISLGFVVWMHILTWLIAIVFARDFLVRETSGRAQRAAQLWLVLVVLVSFQMTTYLRPVLWRSPGSATWAREKMSFFTHLHQVGQWEAPKTTAERVSRAK